MSKKGAGASVFMYVTEKKSIIEGNRDIRQATDEWTDSNLKLL